MDDFYAQPSSQAGLAGPDKRLHWYALYTRSRWEKRISHALTAQSFEVYLPTQHVWDRRTKEPRKVDAPVFPNYLFVRCQLDGQAWGTVRRTMGVVRILGYDSTPTPIPDQEIDSLRRVLRAHPSIEGHPRLRKGDTVQVVKGPMKGVIGTLVEVGRNRHKLVVSVGILNRAVAVKMDASVVVPCSP